MYREPFANGEYYHVYNRGVDKRNIFIDEEDVDRFITSLIKFNRVKPVGSLYELTFSKDEFEDDPLVEIIAYCLNPNHYHLILRQEVEGGISEYVKRLGGYTWQFNKKYNRGGSLFQGKFKSIHVDSNEYLLRLSVYVNLNNKIHQLGGPTAKLVRSSWRDYVERKGEICCEKEIILSQFKNRNDYREFAEQTLPLILKSKKDQKELAKLLLE